MQAKQLKLRIRCASAGADSQPQARPQREGRTRIVSFEEAVQKITALARKNEVTSRRAVPRNRRMEN